MFEPIHHTKEQLFSYERVEKHKANERMFKSFKSEISKYTQRQ